MYMTAGLLGHNGLNEAGVGVCANFVDDPGGWGEGLPRYLLSRLALREERAEAALAAAMRPPRAASRNLLVADSGGDFVDAELLRKEAGLIRGRDGLLVHANHLEAPEFQGYEKPTENSLRRRERLETPPDRRPPARSACATCSASTATTRMRRTASAPIPSPDAMSRRWSR